MDQKTIEYYSCFLQELFIKNEMNPDLATALGTLINMALVIIIAVVLDIVVRKIIVQTFKALSQKTITTFDDFLVSSNFPRFLAHFVPVIIVWGVVPYLFLEFKIISKVVLVALDVYIVVLITLIVRSILRSTRNYLNTKEKYKDKPLESYIQVLMLFAWGVGVFLIINILTGYSVTSLATLGAASAVLLLIFKDTILGFVASIQVTVNDNVRIGDWITFSKYGADGYVIEINLATVRVQNFDNTYTTIPTYSLISDSFQNWRGMQDSKGRRIKRAIYIKQSSVKFLNTEQIEKLKQIQLIKPYIEHKEKEITKYNTKIEADKSLLVNGKNQTNLGIFRKYADAYLHENPAINKDLFLMVRHLAPTDKGIPVEIFCFSYDKKWENYEHIQANIFDHLIAAIPYFDLEIFELPSGNDFKVTSI